MLALFIFSLYANQQKGKCSAFILILYFHMLSFSLYANLQKNNYITCCEGQYFHSLILWITFFLSAECEWQVTMWKKSYVKNDDIPFLVVAKENISFTNTLDNFLSNAGCEWWVMGDFTQWIMYTKTMKLLFLLWRWTLHSITLWIFLSSTPGCKWWVVGDFPKWNVCEKQWNYFCCYKGELYSH